LILSQTNIRTGTIDEQKINLCF